ncbi:hypothetical protein B0H14DRAFT_3519888 [Mycena olivaceomarginata]|nr:hypothetical protein B0H14DRAFT_3519888 [Mycena olivaceomarginata]
MSCGIYPFRCTFRPANLIPFIPRAFGRLPNPRFPSVRSQDRPLDAARAIFLGADFVCFFPFSPPTRILGSLRVRLGIACLRCKPTLRASYSIFFGVVQRGIHKSLPTAILAALSHTASFSVHRVVSVTRLSLGTRSHNRLPLILNSSKYVQLRIRALGPTPLGACSSISLAMCEMLGAALE